MSPHSLTSNSEHRGRIQVQGKDTVGDPSFAWARATPVPKQEALVELHRLRDDCSSKQLALRDQAFEKAEGFIKDGPYRDTPIYRKFQNWNRPKAHKDARVDIEVLHGVAFL